MLCFHLDKNGSGYVQIKKWEMWKWIPAKRQLPHIRGAAHHPRPAAYLPPFYLDDFVCCLDKMGGGIPFCVFI